MKKKEHDHKTANDFTKIAKDLIKELNGLSFVAANHVLDLAKELLTGSTIKTRQD